MTIESSAQRAPVDAGFKQQTSKNFRHAFASRGAMRPRFAFILRPDRGRGECRAPSAPAASCAKVTAKMHTSIHSRFTGNHPAFPHAMVLRFTSSSPRRSGCFATVALRIKVLSDPVEPNEPPQDLTPASRRQDHTTSPSAISAVRRHVPDITHGEQSALRSQLHARRCRVHRIPSRVRDDRDTPLVWDETAVHIGPISISENQNIFCYGTRQGKSHKM
jgi:hypothetical protein